jgi:hypothetical protein
LNPHPGFRSLASGEHRFTLGFTPLAFQAASVRGARGSPKSGAKNYGLGVDSETNPAMKARIQNNTMPKKQLRARSDHFSPISV